MFISPAVCRRRWGFSCTIRFKADDAICREAGGGHFQGVRVPALKNGKFWRCVGEDELQVLARCIFYRIAGLGFIKALPRLLIQYLIAWHEVIVLCGAEKLLISEILRSVSNNHKTCRGPCLVDHAFHCLRTSLRPDEVYLKIGVADGIEMQTPKLPWCLELVRLLSSGFE